MSGSIRGQFTHIYNPVLLLSDLLVSGLSLSLSGTGSGSFGISSSGHLFLAGANQYTCITTSLLGVHIEVANDLGLGINAGHDLNLDNLRYYKDHVHGLLEVSIGHALICDALYYGLKNSIQMYLRQLG